MAAKTNGDLIAETRALIEKQEAGESERGLCIAIQNNVRRLYEDRTQAEVGELIGKEDTWVGRVLKWDSADPQKPTFFAGPRAEGRPNEKKNIARKVLADPEQRREVLESLTDEERMEVATAAIEPETRAGRRQGKEQRAHRESQPHHDRTHVELIASKFERIQIDVIGALSLARDTTWTEEGAAEVGAMIDAAYTRLEVLRDAVQPDSDLDWDAALAKLEESS